MGLTAIFCHFVSLSKSRAKPTFARIYGPLQNKNFLPFSLGEKKVMKRQKTVKPICFQNND